MTGISTGRDRWIWHARTKKAERYSGRFRERKSNNKLHRLTKSQASVTLRKIIAKSKKLDKNS
jgi:hypothetical protein